MTTTTVQLDLALCRRKTIILMQTIALLLFAVASRQASAESDSLEAKLDKRRAEMECPGALVGVFPARAAAQRFCLGVADQKSKRPMRLEMHMRVGSVSKLFLGVVVLQLMEEGKLSLDDPVSKYVPGVPGGEKITLRMLGNNTSGLFNTIENKKYQQAIMKEPGRVWQPKEIFSYTFPQKNYAAPGEKFRYSNTNAVLLAVVVEKVTGNSYAEEIKTRVCKPLRLEQTGIAADGKLPPPCPRSYRNGYPDKVIGYGNVFYDVTSYSSSWTHAAGDLYSTLDDLGKAVKPLATGALLGSAGKKELLHWIDTGHKQIRYGFLIGQRSGGVGHSGDVPGFNAVALYYPQSETTIVALTNLSNNKDGTMPAEELGNLAIEHVHSSQKP